MNLRSVTVGRSYLLNGTLGLEEDASSQQLSEDAAHGPDVNGVGVVTTPHEDFWGAVVLRYHLLSHVARLVQLLHPCQAKITDLEGGYRLAKRSPHFILNIISVTSVEVGEI